MKKSYKYELLQNSLAKIREAQGFTQMKVAERLKQPQSYVSKYENGERRLDVIEFLQVCEALEVPASEVLEKLYKD